MDESTIRVVVRLTARTSLLLFLLAFTGAALKTLWPGGWSERLASRRVAFLRGLAASHLAHFASIVALDGVTQGQALRNQPWAALAGGALAYLFILAMAGWPMESRLNTVGMYYVWVIFLASYAGSTTLSLLYLPVALLVVAALGIRIWAVRAAQKSERQP